MTMTNMELRLYEALRQLRDDYCRQAVKYGIGSGCVWQTTGNADDLIRECEAQIRREAAEVRSD